MYGYERVTLSVVEIDVNELEGDCDTGPFRVSNGPPEIKSRCSL